MALIYQLSRVLHVYRPTLCARLSLLGQALNIMVLRDSATSMICSEITQFTLTLNRETLAAAAARTVLHPSRCSTHSLRDVDTSARVVQSPSVACAAVARSPDESVAPPPRNAPSTLGLQRPQTTTQLNNRCPLGSAAREIFSQISHNVKPRKTELDPKREQQFATMLDIIQWKVKLVKLVIYVVATPQTSSLALFCVFWATTEYRNINHHFFTLYFTIFLHNQQHKTRQLQRELYKPTKSQHDALVNTFEMHDYLLHHTACVDTANARSDVARYVRTWRPVLSLQIKKGQYYD